MNKKIKIILLIGIVGFLCGFLVAKSLTPDLAQVKKSIVDDLRQKLNSRIEKGLIPFFGFPEEVALTSLSGELVKIEENILEVKVRNDFLGGDLFDYLNQPDFYLKKVKVDEATKIVERKGKEMEQLRKEMEELKGGALPLTPYTETEISREDLKEGVSVSVEAKTEFRLEEDKVIEAETVAVAK